MSEITTFEGMKIGDRLRKLRREKEISQEYLADRIGVTQAYISSIENNKSDLDSELIMKIAEVFGVSPAALLVDISDDSMLPPIKKDDDNVFYRAPGHITEEERKKIQQFIEALSKVPEGKKELVYNIIAAIFKETKE